MVSGKADTRLDLMESVMTVNMAVGILWRICPPPMML